MATTTHDRLIINRAGHTVRAIPVNRTTVRIQTGNAVLIQAGENHKVMEIDLEKREAIAFILQIATMIGVAVEVTE